MTRKKPDYKAIVQQRLSADARDAERGQRDAKRDIQRLRVRRAGLVASPAGLAAFFPGLGSKKKKI